MVDMRMNMNARQQTQALPRDKRAVRRLKILKEAHAGMGTVRVVPEEKYRHVLKHPGSTVGFRATGGAEWPNDRFTQRRLRDGSVKLEEAKRAAKPEGQPAEAKPEKSEAKSQSAPAPSA